MCPSESKENIHESKNGSEQLRVSPACPAKTKDPAKVKQIGLPQFCD